MLHALDHCGVDVPGQVAVIGFDIGFDNITVTATACTNPPLSSVDPGVGDVAKVAVQRLVGRIRGTLHDPPAQFVTDFSIVRRAGT